MCIKHFFKIHWEKNVSCLNHKNVPIFHNFIAEIIMGGYMSIYYGWKNIQEIPSHCQSFSNLVKQLDSSLNPQRMSLDDPLSPLMSVLTLTNLASAVRQWEVLPPLSIQNSLEVEQTKVGLNQDHSWVRTTQLFPQSAGQWATWKVCPDLGGHILSILGKYMAFYKPTKKAEGKKKALAILTLKLLLVREAFSMLLSLARSQTQKLLTDMSL